MGGGRGRAEFESKNALSPCGTAGSTYVGGGASSNDPSQVAEPESSERCCGGSAYGDGSLLYIRVLLLLLEREGVGVGENLISSISRAADWRMAAVWAWP